MRQLSSSELVSTKIRLLGGQVRGHDSRSKTVHLGKQAAGGENAALKL